MSNLYHNSFFSMGTRFHIVLPGIDDERGESMFAVIRTEVNRVENNLSRFLPNSEISIVNKNASKEPVPVSDELFRILDMCRKYSGLTRGAFDISLRPLLQYWKGKEANNKSDHELYKIMDSLGMKQILLDEEKQTVGFANDRVEIDLGGFGKGYALEKIKQKLKGYSVQDAFISFGESSVLTLGSHPAGDHWKVGLNNYHNPGEALYTFSVNEGAVSTSSNFFVDDSGSLQNHRHVINPFTGYPVDECITVSVKSSSSTVAEVLSTAILVSGDETVKWIREQVDIPCEIVKVVYGKDEPEVTVHD